MKFIQTETKNRLRIIILSNPKKNNALNIQAYNELTESLNSAANDDAISLCAITGAGKYYSSGNDLSYFMQVEDPNAALVASREILNKMIRAFFNFPKPLICVANGPCIGIAATTAALCDVVYCSEKAYFYTPFSLLGLCVEGCASYTFPRILGKSKASEMLLFNHKLNADEALKFGFVSAVFKQSEIESTLWPRIEEMAKLSTASLKVTKSILKKFETKRLEDVLELELEELYKRFDSPDFYDGLSKFFERKSKL